ncbi:MAG: tRNA (adenosine(37)-N6)-threonylcarbamoyltransferase complex dimerization subunit type 1 TsaB [Candidatus Tectomicrobia bacterium]|uniref:tRNA (Adenosine(37)-N6)-threonylcarbamoyltransferase complex dimerization subunit type 1 TsaB n=1 Tax=Tectimicrobiota bacterium TaxID=2528274 RepID=A0A932GMV6_UNCTE|nr:tRNA (adenosine(37)-N6)-threonylcarbamoyltransferase complex dimerization subunit type 1 TsaB [Candidatus Tectomicrobia bacterium]
MSVDTSTLQGSVALAQDGRVVSERRVGSSSSHARTLLTIIDGVLTSQSLKPRDLGALVATAGPGSFTGLRIGISTVKGLAYGLGIPAVGVPTLDAMASRMDHPDLQLCPLLDARKSEVYCGFYRCQGERIEKVTEAMVLPPAKLCPMICEPTLFFGEGARVYGTFLMKELGEKARFRGEEGLDSVAVAAARIGWQSLSGAGEASPPPKLELLYVRPSEAELQRQSRGEKGGPDARC